MNTEKLLEIVRKVERYYSGNAYQPSDMVSEAFGKLADYIEEELKKEWAEDERMDKVFDEIRSNDMMWGDG